MPTTDYKYAGTAATVDRDSKDAWTNPDYAKTDDGNYAISNPNKAQYSDWLRLTNFGFTSTDVPAGSTIDGIEVTIERYGYADNKVKDSAIYLRNSTPAQCGDNKASATWWPSSVGTADYGGVADTWNAGLTQADIVSSNFGIDLSAYTTANSRYVEYIKIRITYTPSGGGGGVTGRRTAHGFVHTGNFAVA